MGLVLRFEDTDAGRNRPERVQGILDAWGGLALVRVSAKDRCSSPTNAQHHREAIDRLLAAGLALLLRLHQEQAVARTGSEHKGYELLPGCGLPAGEGRACGSVPPTTARPDRRPGTRQADLSTTR